MDTFDKSSGIIAQQLAKAYERGRRKAFDDSAKAKSTKKEAGYGEAAILGGVGGALIGGPLGDRYGEYVAGESPHYRDVLRKKLLFQILGTLSGALVGAGAAVGARSFMDHTGRLL